MLIYRTNGSLEHIISVNDSLTKYCLGSTEIANNWMFKYFGNFCEAYGKYFLVSVYRRFWKTQTYTW